MKKVARTAMLLVLLLLFTHMVLPIRAEAATESTTTNSKTENTITASNKTITSSSKAKTFSIKAKAKDNAKLTYQSDSKNVTVNSKGTVTIKKDFIGSATITITAKETDNYITTTKEITVTVNPPKTSITKIEDHSAIKISVQWKKVSGITGYQLQYAIDGSFQEGHKVKIKSASTLTKTLTDVKDQGSLLAASLVRIRTYKTIGKKTYYSAWSQPKALWSTESVSICSEGHIYSRMYEPAFSTDMNGDPCLSCYYYEGADLQGDIMWQANSYLNRMGLHVIYYITDRHETLDCGCVKTYAHFTYMKN